MPLKRTPPSSPAPALIVSAPMPIPPQPSAPVSELLVPHNQQLQHSSSEPTLNITHRKRKRSLGGDEEKFNDFMKEMRSMFSLFKEDQDKRADRLCAAVEDMRASLDYLSKNLELAQARIVHLETAREADARSFKAMEDRLEALERGSRSTCLEIRNIPMPPAENKLSLLSTFIGIGEVLNVPIQKTEVKDIYRIRSKDPARRTIIVDLCSNLQREEIISMYHNFNKGTSRLTTEHLRMKGPPKPIFISENLTSKMKRLFFLARDYAKVNNYKFCWVSHGKIFLRNTENGPLIRVTTESDLKVVQNPK